MTLREVNNSAFREALSLINRKTKRADLKDNYLALLIFEKYNTSLDKNGKRDDKFDAGEYSAFTKYLKQINQREKILKKSKQTSDTKKMEKELGILETKLNELNAKWCNCSNKSSWNDLLKCEEEFEEKYGNELLRDIQDKNEAGKAILAGALIRNISSFERGLRNDKEKKFEGVQTLAYIQFPLDMEKEERERILSIIDNAIDQQNRLVQIQEEISRVEKQYMTIQSTLYDMYLGEKEPNGSSSFEKWQNNNFVNAEIEKLSKEREELWHKYELTDAEKKKLESLNKRLEQLYSVDFSNTYAFPDNNFEKSGLSATYEESAVYQDNDESGTGSKIVKDSHTIRSSWGIHDWVSGFTKIGLNFTKKEQHVLEQGKAEEGENLPDKHENSYIINPSLNYSIDKFKASADMTWNINPDKKDYQKSHTFSAAWAKTLLKLELNPSKRTFNGQNDKGEEELKEVKSKDTKVSFEQNFGNYGAKTYMKWQDGTGRVYGVGVNTSFDKNFTKQGLSLNISPEAGFEHINRWDERCDATGISGGLTLSGNYSKGDFNYMLMVIENADATIEKSNSLNNMFMINGNAGYKKVSLNLEYMNQISDSKEYKSKTNQVGIGLTYNIPIGEIEGKYTLSKSEQNSAEACKKSYTTNTVNLSLKVKTDSIKSIVHKKKKTEPKNSEK